MNILPSMSFQAAKHYRPPGRFALSRAKKLLESESETVNLALISELDGRSPAEILSITDDLERFEFNAAVAVVYEKFKTRRQLVQMHALVSEIQSGAAEMLSGKRIRKPIRQIFETEDFEAESDLTEWTETETDGEGKKVTTTKRVF